MTEMRGGETVRCLKIVAVLSLSLASREYAAQTSQLTAEQARVLETARTGALQYALQLPNFVCVQITRREVIDEKNFHTLLIPA